MSVLVSYRLFAGNEYINSFNSLEHLGTIKGELEQALEKVTERIGQLHEAKQINAYRQQVGSGFTSDCQALWGVLTAR